ncbi:MAG: C39 family peptidase, partial [Anaerolineales bacterium]
MLRKIILVGTVLFGMAAAAGPLQVSAGGDPLASPTPQPTQRITAPVISGVNPEVYLSEGEQGDITPSDIPEPLALGFSDPVPAPVYKELEPLRLAVPFQAQEGDVDCGPASLAMALTYLNQREGGPPLSTQELGSWLRQRGLMYDWGTGVEELAFAARDFGYPGSTALHDWTLEELMSEVNSGRPVLVPLGRGPDGAGHFLTITGVSPDGKVIFGLDPLKGAVEYSAEEFRSLWEMQGNSALILHKEAPSPLADLSLPLLGLVSAVSALALAGGLGSDKQGSNLLAGLRKELADPHRQGIGGGVQADSPAGVSSLPPGESGGQPPPGFKQAQLEVPVYETRPVQVGLRGVKVQVPVYETRKVLAGLRKDVQQIPVYGLKKVITGTRWVEKRIPVTRYRNKQVWTWKKITKRVPVTRRIHGKSIVIGYKNQTSWKRVQVTKKVPYQTSKTLLVKEPVYGYQKVQTGTRTITRWVPRYQEKQVQVGTKTVYQTVPVYEQRRVQVGTRTVTRLVPIEEGNSGPPKPGGDPGDDGTERDPASDLRLLDKLIVDHDQASPPTGFSPAVWESLSELDQTRLRQDGSPVVGGMDQSGELRLLSKLNLNPDGSDKNEDSSLSPELLQEFGQLTQKGLVPTDLDQLLNEAGREYELTEKIYLKGGPGATSYGEKAEDGWSQHSYGGNSLPF